MGNTSTCTAQRAMPAAVHVNPYPFLRVSQLQLHCMGRIEVTLTQAFNHSGPAGCVSTHKHAQVATTITYSSSSSRGSHMSLLTRCSGSDCLSTRDVAAERCDSSSRTVAGESCWR